MAEVVKATAGNQNVFSGVIQWPARVREYVSELNGEMRRVTWPARKQVQATTGVVIAAVFLFAAYFWAVDILFGRLVGQLFAALTRR
jgi:preprotein translocase subunit SecE